MTTTVRREPTFGRRGDGPPQRSRLVAAAPVVASCALSAKPRPAPTRIAPSPSRISIAIAALFKTCTSATAAALTRLRVAAMEPAKNVKTAVANRRAKWATAKAEAHAAKVNATQPLGSDDRAASTLELLDEVDASRFDIPAEIEATKFAIVAETAAAAPEAQTEAAVEHFHTPELAVSPPPTPRDHAVSVDAVALDLDRSISDQATFAAPLDQASTAEASHTATAPTVGALTTVAAVPSALLPEHFPAEHDLQDEPSAADVDEERVACADISEDRIWVRAYFTACAAAFPTAIALTGLLGGPTNPFAGLGIVLQALLAVVSPLLGLIFFLPAVALVQLARRARLPRGLAYALTGGLLGSVWLLLNLYDGTTPPLAAYCLIAGGLVGGLVFWLTNHRVAAPEAADAKSCDA